MARGQIAKENVIKVIQKAFGDNYIGEADKKFYVWADDGGEKVQIAISMTCPKTFIEAAAPQSASEAPAGGWNFEDIPTPVKTKPAEISQEEMDRIADMMARLGL